MEIKSERCENSPYHLRPTPPTHPLMSEVTSQHIETFRRLALATRASRMRSKVVAWGLVV
eukprot:scaffold439856_cov17-Prasinocladus_malaysianus.AAC.1